MIEEIREELRLFNCGFNTSDRVIKCHNNILKILDKYNTPNKGIDETIEEIEFEINNNFVVGGTYNRLNCLLQDLKKLKGE